MRTATMIPHEELLQILHYEPETGWFTWKVVVKSHGGGRLPGERAGNLMTIGYRHIGILGKCYYEHRLAVFYMTGHWPKEVDHINSDKADTRWANLREISRSTNIARCLPRSTNTSGVTGVWWNKNRLKWMAEIKFNYKKICLGQFKKLEEAAAARHAAENQYFPDLMKLAA